VGSSTPINDVAGQQQRPTSLFDLGNAHLREQRQVVLDMPIVGDAAVRDLQEVGRDEIDRLDFALALPKVPVKCPRKSMCTVT
jgi:hypothetical protein